MSELSVVIPTTQPWPEVQACLDAVYAEARALDAEIIVASRADRSLPADVSSRYSEIEWIFEPGASVYRLRELAIARARGRVVLLTEDHCVPHPGWCEAHLRAHQAMPAVDVVGGAVANAATRTAAARASFFLNHSEFAPPLESGARRRLDRSNVSYKRSLLPTVASDDGRDELFIDEELEHRGARCHVDAGIVVDHDQDLGPRGTVVIQYHNGRTVAGFRVLRGLTLRARILRAVGGVALTPVRVLEPVLELRRRGLLDRAALASIPMMAVVAFAIGFGKSVGAIAGPGRSASAIR